MENTACLLLLLNQSQQELITIRVFKQIFNKLIQAVSKDYWDIDKMRALRFRYKKDTSAYLKKTYAYTCADYSTLEKRSRQSFFS